MREVVVKLKAPVHLITDAARVFDRAYHDYPLKPGFRNGVVIATGAVAFYVYNAGKSYVVAYQGGES